MSYQQEIAEGYFLLARPVAVIRFFLSSLVIRRGTGIRGLMRGMATLLQGYQELLLVRDKVRRPQVILG